MSLRNGGEDRDTGGIPGDGSIARAVGDGSLAWAVTAVQKMDTPATTNPKDLLGASKVPLSKIPPIALLHLAMAMAEGAAKYGAFNWRDKAVQADIYIDATMRHLLAWADGEELSPDAQIHHLGHAMASLAILLDAQATGNLVDNRPKNGRTGEFLEKLNAQLKQKRAKK